MEVHEVTLTVTSTPEGAARVRHQVMNEIRGWRSGIGTDGMDVAEAVAGELLANAVQHAGDGAASVTARPRGSRLRFEVRDRSSALPHARLPRTDAEDGRGLLIIAALADRHGVDHSASGKSCWAELDLSVPTPSITQPPLQRS
ncbi:ATP-binding protein [Streptomyces sp. ISL-43]|uniref:ATP-binding protein n=1 Tax=Streptomyces sp. ISL-43 TaxID=2819183 RepID=UPI001BE733C1|nr:ATP-binding protein [Streptomyces sp. ISL-43]MBT2451060.1 ATP-binding protein [Streptomyces sp. ISL-43]